jgi:hypothetical protein
MIFGHILQIFDHGVPQCHSRLIPSSLLCLAFRQDSLRPLGLEIFAFHKKKLLYCFRSIFLCVVYV